MKRLVLIDAYSLLHRAYFALPKTITLKDGQPVNAVFGFTRMLLKVLRDLGPDYMALVYDSRGPTFREALYKAYKEGRPVMEEELKKQLGSVAKVAGAMNLRVFQKEGFEADDLLAAMAEKVKEAGVETVIVSGDSDLLQLVAAGIHVYYPLKGLAEGKLYDEKAVSEKYGFEAERVVDYKALRGDPSDNIPGVKGIGEKTAVELLKKFGGLEGVYKNLEKIDKRVADLLREGRDSAHLSYKLAKLRRDVPLEFKLEDLKISFDKEELLKIFKRLEFKSLIKQLERDETFPKKNQLSLL